jgi:hypothetical protein
MAIASQRQDRLARIDDAIIIGNISRILRTFIRNMPAKSEGRGKGGQDG